MSNTIQAAVFRGESNEAKIETLHVQEFRDDEVLVKLVATGICHTDLSCRSGSFPLPRPVVLGHEGAGVVEKVGAKVSAIKPGYHVVISFLPCGKCKNCIQGKPAFCTDNIANNMTGRRADGSTALVGSTENDEVSAHFLGQSSFATHSVANERNVVKVRDDAPLELLGPLGCGIQTGAGAVLNTLKPQANDAIAVHGAGGVGLAAVMAAVVVGCSNIIVIEPNSTRREIALEVGATHVIDPKAEEDTTQAIKNIVADGVDHVVDTTGITEIIVPALDALASGGKIALIAINKPDAILSLPFMTLMTKYISVHSICMGNGVPKTFIPELVDLIIEGKFPLEKLVRYYEFADINQALQDQEDGTTIKPILRMPTN